MKENLFYSVFSLITLLISSIIAFPPSSHAQTYKPAFECRGAPAASSASDLTFPPNNATTLRIVKPVDIKESITIQADLCFMRSGQFNVDAGVNILFMGEIYAGPWHIFNYLEQNAAMAAGYSPIVYPEWWGAKTGDNENDTLALRYAANYVSESDGGTIELSKGVYIVGMQSPTTGNPFPVFHEPILEITDTSRPVVINGNGATLIAEDGLLFGYFDQNGPTDPTSQCGAASPNAANAYTMINVEFNASVSIRDIELDGNIFGLELGGRCSDGRQLFGYGIRAYNNEALLIENIYAHHNALDGIVVGFHGLTEGDSLKPTILRNIVSEHNARQGISVVGANDLKLSDCKLNHTGKARFASPPGAGLDLEAEESVVRNVFVDNCEVINNTGAGIVSDSGDGGYTTVSNSTIWGTTNYSVFPRNPGMVFQDSTIYGSIPNPYGSDNPNLATKFRRVHFEDLEYGEFGVFRSNGALLELAGENVLIEDSTIVANDIRALWLDGTDTREILRRVEIYHGDSDRIDHDFQSLIRGSYLEDVTFKEAFSSKPKISDGWYISQGNVTYSNLCIDGPWVRWASWSYGAGAVTGCPIP